MQRAFQFVSAPFIFVYEFVHESLGWVGTVLTIYLTYEAVWATGGTFYDLMTRVRDFVVEVFTTPLQTRTLLGGAALLLSFGLALYKTGAIMKRIRSWLEQRSA